MYDTNRISNGQWIERQSSFGGDIKSNVKLL